MSGDASLYVRGKAQERQGADAKFMMDGFDRWAESEAPSRVGGADKMGNDEIYGEGRRRRHRSSKAIHRYADKHERSMEGAGRRRVAKMRGHRSPSSSSCSSSSDSDDDSYGSGSSSDSSESSVGSGLGRHRRRRRGGAHQKGHMDSSSSSGSESDDGKRDVVSSGSESGGPVRFSGGNTSARQLVNSALDTWYNVSIGGKPLNNWTLVPQKMKDFVGKINEVWKQIEGNAQLITNIKGAIASRAPAVADAISRLGFGRKRGYKVHNRVNQYLVKLAKHHRRGGDAFDDKLDSFGIKSLYNNSVKNYSDLTKKVDQGARTLYNGYRAIADNGDMIKEIIDQAPVPSGAKTAVRNVVGKMEQLKQQGLGRKGKRAPSQRNMMVAKLMREKGMTLGEASKAVSAMMKRGGAEL